MPTAAPAACSIGCSRREGVARLEGAHCYEVYAGRAAFAALSDEEPGTFYLTDFLVRNFDRLVIRGLGLDRHPELLPLYFGNYRRLVYLAQTDDPELDARAEAAAGRLGLAFERRLDRPRRARPGDRGLRRGRAGPRGRLMAPLITIWWRDIPMQVTAREGRRSEKRVLDKRFQIAVDKAAMKSGKKSYGDYIEEMRRAERECGADLEAEANAEMARLDAAYTKEILRTLVAAGGEGERL